MNSRRNIITLTENALRIEEEVYRVVYQWNMLIHQGIEQKELMMTISSLNKMVENTEGYE